jgi:hypothetical protein
MRRVDNRGYASGFALCLFIALALWAGVPAGAQTTRDTAVMPFIGNDPALAGRMQNAAIREIGNQEGFTPRLREGPPPARVDEPPDPSLLGGMPYALTGEHYFDTDGLQHCQLWLWESESGALVYTDELMAEDGDEAEGYLPVLTRWVFSQVPPVEEAAAEPQAAVPAEGPAAGDAAGSPEAAEGFKPGLYLGLRAGGSVDSHGVRDTGSTGLSFGGEAAVTVEYRPWRYAGFQAEGVFVLESTTPSTAAEDFHTSGSHWGMSLLFPLLVKVSIDLEALRTALVLGPYYILPLNKSLGGDSYRETLDVPLGIMAGFDLGFVLGSEHWFGGELYGSLRYGIDLGLTTVRGLSYARKRLVLSAGYRIRIMGK